MNSLVRYIKPSQKTTGGSLMKSLETLAILKSIDLTNKEKTAQQDTGDDNMELIISIELVKKILPQNIPNLVKLFLIEHWITFL